MGDLISRQAVIDALKEHRALYCDNTPDAFLKLPYAEKSRVDEIDTAIATIVNLPSVEIKSEWIPVTEKLPSDCGHDWVLAQIQEDNGYLWIPCVAEYRKFSDDWFTEANETGWLSRHKGAFKVIAWQPLPEPYKAESEEQVISRKVKADSIEVWKAKIVEREHIKELLDEIRAEIDQLPLVLLAGNYHIDKDSVMQILDKYRVESEDT